MPTLRTVVRDLRRTRGWSLRDVEARAAGQLTYGAVAMIERGRTTDPKWSTVRALASAFGLSTAALVAMIETPRRRRPGVTASRYPRLWRRTGAPGARDSPWD